MSASAGAVTDLTRRRGGRRRKNLGAGEGDPESDNAVLVDEEPDGQKRMEGMERVADKDLEDLAWKVHGHQTKRMQAAEKEKTARQELTDMMIEKKLDSYPLDDEYEAVLKTSTKAYVRKRKNKDEGE